MNIRIAMADDHPMVINGVKDMLAGYPHLRLVATYLNGTDLLEGLKNDLPDVLLLDIQLPDKTGNELAHTIVQEYPQLRILTLTNFNHMLYINMMLKIGVHGYLLKDTDQRTLVTAIETVYNGGTFLTPEMERLVADANAQQKGKSDTRFVLTPRELDILKLIVAAYSNHEIAERLCLGQRTVENYRYNLSVKIGAKNTAGLIRKALELGLV
ncbi:response regulator [Chitinophagaceae bacterium MMS25-I14]